MHRRTLWRRTARAITWETFEDGSCRFRSIYFHDDGTVKCVSPWHDHFCPAYPCMALEAPDTTTLPICGATKRRAVAFSGPEQALVEGVVDQQ